MKEGTEEKEQAETFTTLVSYFNFKELGGANVLYQDQVIEKLKYRKGL